MCIRDSPTIYGLQSTETTGTTKTVEVKVYWNSGCTEEVTRIEWGIIEPGSVKEIRVFVKNTGNVNIILSLETKNWNPSNASKYITLTWNYRRQTLSPNKYISLKLKLSVSPKINGMRDFSFDTLITGIQKR